MIARRVVAAFALLTAPGCVYYNAIYNAERLFQDGEAHHWAGRDSAAAARYDEVLAKAANGFRRGPEGPWSDEALLLLGRAHLRLGDLAAAVAALEAAAERAETPDARWTALVYLGAARVEAGELEAGVELLDEALRRLGPGPVAAEGHLVRGRALLGLGQREEGWWDVGRAAPIAQALRTPSALETVAWAVRLDEPDRAAEALARLFAWEEAGSQVDAVAALARSASARWGPTTAASLLAGSDTAAWDRSARNRIRLARAGFLRAAGDTAGAAEELGMVADGIGQESDEARIALARWQLEGARSLLEAEAVVPILLPASASAQVGSLLEDVEAALTLAAAGFGDPLAWFAAGERFRDRLGARALAHGLFLAYADAAPDEPWALKALLAALDTAVDEADRSWLRGRLEGRPSNPYVRAARGLSAPGLEALDAELGRRLQEVTAP